MSEMMERVARAIDPEAFLSREHLIEIGRRGLGPDLTPERWADQRLRAHYGRRKSARASARAAIEAMRAPTEAMKEAGSDIGNDSRTYGCDMHDFMPECAEAAWERMIDEALK